MAEPRAWAGTGFAPLVVKGVTGMDSSTTVRGWRPFWLVLGGSGAIVALVGLLAVRRTSPRQEHWWQRAGPHATRSTLAKDVRQAGRAVARGVEAGLAAVWDVAVGGADAVRTAANVGPAVLAAVAEAQAALARALARLRYSTVSFLTATFWTLFWVGLAALVATFVYLPEPGQRRRFFERTRQSYHRLRSLLGYGR